MWLGIAGLAERSRVPIGDLSRSLPQKEDSGAGAVSVAYGCVLLAAL